MTTYYCCTLPRIYAEALERKLHAYFADLQVDLRRVDDRASEAGWMAIYVAAKTYSVAGRARSYAWGFSDCYLVPDQV